MLKKFKGIRQKSQKNDLHFNVFPEKIKFKEISCKININININLILFLFSFLNFFP